jgi:hypothetical protein
MTLQPYNPDKLDQLALRLLDQAAAIREMANVCREHQIGDFALHDKKASEWCDLLERWTSKARTELQMKVIDVRATHRAEAIARRQQP